MVENSKALDAAKRPAVFYGWYIVGVGVLVHVAASFSFSSTLSVFLKPITEELGVSRGAFSLIRTAEIGVAAFISPFLGPWVDRYGGRWLLAIGVLMEGVGFLLLSQVEHFWQFALVRCCLVIAGETLLGGLIINVTIAQWFVRARGRAIAIANLGTGVAKVSIPLGAAWLINLAGWRSAWAILGVLAPLLVVAPALKFIRRRPEDMGLRPDGDLPSAANASSLVTSSRRSVSPNDLPEAEISWSRMEVLRLPTFWLLVITFGIVSVGIVGLNLHLFSFVTDIGYSPIVAATFMSTIAFTQLGSTYFWGTVADRFEIKKVFCIQFLIQGVGLVLAISSREIYLLYIGFFIYGIGLAGGFVLREVIWANFFGRISLGTVRGLSLFFSHLFAAAGAPFFGFLHDRTGNYNLSFTIFSCALFTSAFLILLAKSPRKIRPAIGSAN